ncbi:hypothetical protein COJ85_24495 [Bacillus sp. AFS076308]|uniref:DUF6954 family protein n=1 Tax=unclassified Bacillus (in: firmicutes) TaxID=185979 RepID=UPI000BF6F761|nr:MULTISPECIES: hypothetical protein [unclassified Bacillus (in: firmicutes)]PFN96482.1 hypothetical protein COJ85_24495 [Bacillus sp. AFS076308]PGV46655.1 hypothetical protein COD92_29805 [Bacillus sp. AFS037270]
MKIFLHTFFIILLSLVTFFGLGPVLMADGVMQERIWTAVIVIVLYLVIAFCYRKACRWAAKK